MAQGLTGALIENILTLLCWHDEQGRVVSNLVDPSLFEGDYRTIAERAIDYWHKHATAPKHHTADLIADILEDPANRRAGNYRRILGAMFELSGNVNTQYVLEQLRNFTRVQRLKAAIIQSGEQLHARQDMAIAEVEQIWHELLRVRELNFDPGMRITDIDRTLQYMQTQYSEFKTGIVQLDERNIVPYRDALYLILGATGRGKSWFAIHLGKHALQQRKKIVHISLEMSEEQVAQRYLQSLFSIPKREPTAIVRTLETDSLGRLEDMGSAKVTSDFTFGSDMIREELTTRLTWHGRRFEDLIIKRFPPHSITGSEIRSYLDNLELTERFIPDMLIVDYLGLMKIDMRNPRLSLGRNGMDLRAICVERHLAGVAPQQVSKLGASARVVSHIHVAEDWSLTNTADTIVTISSTAAEKRLGLARLFASKARDEEDSFGVLITQNFRMGQFALESARLSSSYYEHLEELKKEDEDDEDGSEYDEDAED